MDPAAMFVRLWTRHQGEVERYVFMMVPRSTDAAEVVQEVSVRLWEKWSSYDQSLPFAPWAIRFAYFEILVWRRRQAREKLIFSDSLLEQINSRHDDEAPIMEARREALQSCLDELTDQQRKWINLRYGRHGAMKEESQRAGVSLHKLYYALEKIRLQLIGCVDQTMKQEGWSDA